MIDFKPQKYIYEHWTIFITENQFTEYTNQTEPVFSKYKTEI